MRYIKPIFAGGFLASSASIFAAVALGAVNVPQPEAPTSVRVKLPDWPSQALAQPRRAVPAQPVLRAALPPAPHVVTPRAPKLLGTVCLPTTGGLRVIVDTYAATWAGPNKTRIAVAIKGKDIDRLHDDYDKGFVTRDEDLNNSPYDAREVLYGQPVGPTWQLDLRQFRAIAPMLEEKVKMCSPQIARLSHIRPH